MGTRVLVTGMSGNGKTAAFPRAAARWTRRR